MTGAHKQRVADLQDKQRRLTGALVALRKPTIAALPGPAAGAGLSIALACDLRIAAESAFQGCVRQRTDGAFDAQYGVHPCKSLHRNWRPIFQRLLSPERPATSTTPQCFA